MLLLLVLFSFLLPHQHYFCITSTVRTTNWCNVIAAVAATVVTATVVALSGCCYLAVAVDVRRWEHLRFCLSLAAVLLLLLLIVGVVVAADVVDCCC